MSVYQPDCGNLVTALQTGTTRRVRQLLLAKHLFEQRRGLCCRIGANLLYLLTQFVEQTIEGRAHHVAIEVEALASQQCAGHGVLGYRVELLDDPTFPIDW